LNQNGKTNNKTTPTHDVRITVSCPPISDNFAYYPYIDSIIRDEVSDLDVEFNQCIYHRFTSENVNQFNDKLINTDILMLSLYIWNYELQMILTNHARVVNPNIKIVAGGPQLHYTDYDMFDYNVIGEAECSVRKIVQGEGQHIMHSPRKTEFSASPYINQLNSLIDIKNDSSNPLGIIFETSRGCPYACSYCDWGSLTLSKVHFYDIDRVKNELETICRDIKPNYLFLADANFGIVDRDIEIAEHIVNMKRIYGFPKSFYYSVSMNNADRNFKIGKILYDGGVVDNYIVSVVHTNRDVLKINSRGNIKTERFKELSQKCADNRLPTQTQLILGMPGDTVEKWFDSFCETFEWGLHAETKPYWYNVLPNAPANNEKFWNEWNIETRDVIFTQARLRADDELIDKTSKIIVSCKSFNTDDWMLMNIDSRWLQSLHNFALLRNVAMFYRHVYNIDYNTFYSGVIGHLYSTDIGYHFNNQYQSYLEKVLDTRNQRKFVPFKFNGNEVSVEPEDVLFMHILDHKHIFYDIVYKYLVQNNLDDEQIINDLIEYQSGSIIDISYNPSTGRQFNLKYDWDEWFSNLSGYAYFREIIQHPKPKDIKYFTNQTNIYGSTEFTSSRILWHKAKNERRKLQLYAKAILGQIDFRGERTRFTEWTKSPL